MGRTKRFVLPINIVLIGALVSGFLAVATGTFPNRVEPVKAAPPAPPLRAAGDSCGPDSSYGYLYDRDGDLINARSNWACVVVKNGGWGTWTMPAALPDGSPVRMHAIGGGGGGTGVENRTVQDLCGLKGNAGYRTVRTYYKDSVAPIINTTVGYSVGPGGAGGNAGAIPMASSGQYTNVAGQSGGTSEFTVTDTNGSNVTYTQLGGTGGNISTNQILSCPSETADSPWKAYGQSYDVYVPLNDWRNGRDGGTGAVIFTFSFPNPSAPTNVSATNVVGTPGDATVSWSAPADATSNFITDYTAEAVSSDGGVARTCTVSRTGFSSPATSCTMTGLSLGKSYTVTVKSWNVEGYGNATATSSAFVVTDPPNNTVAPVVSGAGGKFTIGAAVTATNGTWTGDNSPAMTFAYQWQRCTTTNPATCADIPGRTLATYTPVAGDGNKFLRIKVTATNEYGSTIAYSVLSANQEIATAPVFTAASPPVVADEGYFPQPPYAFAASGGRVTYSIDGAAPLTGLPPGLSINGTTGAFTGSPNVGTAGVYTYKVVATNDFGTASTSALTLTVSSGVVSAMAITTQPAGGASGAVLGTQPVLTLTDSAGRRVATPTAVVATVTGAPAGVTLGGTTTINSSVGLATFTNLTLAGLVNTDYSLTFTSGGLTAVSGNIRVTPGAVHALTITTQPVSGASAGSVLTTQPVLSVRDAQGNLINDRATTIITTSVLSSNTATAGGSVGGSDAVGLTTTNGTVTFTNLTFGGTIGTNYKLKFTSGAVSVLSNDVSSTSAGSASRLGITTQPALSAAVQVGSAFSTQPVISILDAGGNPTTSTASVTATASGGVLGGSSSVAGINGTATFANLTFAGAIGTSYTLTFSSPGLTSITSSSFSFTNANQRGPVSTLTSTVSASPIGVVADGVATTTITVQMRDVGGNALNTSGGIVTLSATVGSLGAVTDNADGTYSSTFTAPNQRGTGTAVITGTLAGQPLTQSGTVLLWTAQTISFTPNAVTLGTLPFALTATASSLLPVSYTLGGGTTNGACTVTSAGVVTVHAIGSCQVVASQAGDTEFAPATPVTRSFGVQASPPTAPFIVAVTPSNASASVMFVAPGHTGGAAITDYEYSLDEGVTWVSASSSTSPLTITGLTNGDPYVTLIRAVNSAGPGAASPPSPEFTPTVAGGPAISAGSTTPSAPHGLVAVQDTATSVVLHWRVPLSDGGSIITGHVVVVSPTITCTVTTNMVAGTGTCTASGLTPGQVYAFSVHAENANGQGPAASVTYTTPGGGGGGGGSGGGGTNGTPPDDGETTDPDRGPNPGGPSAPPLPGTDDDGDGVPDPWTPNDDPNNVPGRPCSGCIQLFPAPGDDGDGTPGSGGGGSGRPGVTSSPPGSTPGTITVTTGTGTTIVIGGNNPNGNPGTSTSPNGGLVVQPPGNVPIVLSGLKPGSTVTVWLADNLSITGVVRPDGTVSLSAPLPPGLAAGIYTGRVDMTDANGVARSLLFGFEWMGYRNTLPVTGSGSLDLLVIVMWLFVAGYLVRAVSRRRFVI